MAVSSRLLSFLGPLPGHPEHNPIMSRGQSGHIVKIAEADYGIHLTGEDGGASVIPADYGDLVRLDEAAAHRNDRCFGPSIDAELGKEVGDVGLHGAGADEECCGDLFVRVPLDEQAQYVQFAWRQPCGRSGTGID